MIFSSTLTFLFYSLGLIVGIIYLFIILFFYKGWKQIPEYHPTKPINNLKISVIIPVRNEKGTVHNLIRDLEQQNYPENNYEVILVDDHSTDGSYDFLKEQLNGKPNYKILHNDGFGKKQALLAGIDQSMGDIIITTDADCRFGKEWLLTVSGFFQEKKPAMVLGPVIPIRKNTFINDLLALEFLSLMGSTAGAAGIGHPIMSNGANLAYLPDVLHELKDPFLKRTPSGEDVFLMLNIKRTRKFDIKFLKSKEAAAYTPLQMSVKGFLHQRIRWVSKNKMYRDADVIITSLVVWLTNFILLSSLLAIILRHEYIILFAGLLILKSFPDYLLLREVTRFFERERLLRLFLPLQLIYIVYVTFIGLFGIFHVGFSWKERKY